MENGANELNSTNFFYPSIQQLWIAQFHLVFQMQEMP